MNWLESPIITRESMFTWQKARVAVRFYIKILPDDAHPLKRPRKKSILDFEYSIPRE